MNAKPISLLICALGGEGGGVLTEWLVETARLAGYPVQATSIPGVAQRTGSTTYYLEVFPVPIARLDGRKPVFSLNPVPGALDAIVSSELLEMARQVTNGMASPDRTLVITSSSRTLTTQERMQLGDGRFDTEQLARLVQRFSRVHRVFDMNAIAKQSGTIVSAVMLGAIAGSGIFPFAREDYEKVVRAGGGTSAQASLRGFDKAFEICRAGFDPASPAVDRPRRRVEPGVTAQWPALVAEFATLGIQRLTEYQSPAYASLYEQRLAKILDAEREAGSTTFETTRETARWLALWMAFDDIVRVADLKSRAARWQRVQREVKAGEGDLLALYDHFKPGVPEFAALLPEALAVKLTAWDRRRVARGGTSWALPLKVGTHTVFGMLALRALASLKWLRVRGSRWAAEQRMIDKWLAGVVDGTRRHWQLGREIALCGRLIKGYGSTNERGKENLLHVLDELATRADAPAAARAVAAAREAALADEAGNALDAELVRQGARPRPIKAQPIRFMPRMMKETPR